MTVLANNHDHDAVYVARRRDDGRRDDASAFVLSVRGIPQLYAGEEIAMEGEDPDNRRDFRVRRLSRRAEAERAREMFDRTKSWIRLRREQAGDAIWEVDRPNY